jgi:hypothetical protein
MTLEIWGREYMGVPSLPIRLGGHRVKIAERVHPEADKFKDGDLHWTQEEKDGDVDLVVYMTERTWQFMARWVLRIEEPFYVKHWGEMPDQQFQSMIPGMERRIRQHFQEEEVLWYILSSLSEQLHKRQDRLMTPEFFDEVRTLISAANHQIMSVIEPHAFMAPIQFVVEKQNPDNPNGVNIGVMQPLSFPHEEFLKEFGEVIQAFQVSLNRRTVLKADDFFFPPPEQ